MRYSDSVWTVVHKEVKEKHPDVETDKLIDLVQARIKEDFEKVYIYI